MYFRLRSFARKEMKEYTFTRTSNTIGVGEVSEGTITENTYPALIVMKTKKNHSLDNSFGGSNTRQLNIKIEKIYSLETGDKVTFQGTTFKVKEIVPREYADFYEAVGELDDGC